VVTGYNGNHRRKCIISEKRFVLELPTSRASLATARPSCNSMERLEPVTKFTRWLHQLDVRQLVFGLVYQNVAPGAKSDIMIALFEVCSRIGMV